MLRRWVAAAAARTRARLIAAGKLEEVEEEEGAEEDDYDRWWRRRSQSQSQSQSRGEAFCELQEYLRLIASRDEAFDVDSYQHVLQLCTRLRASDAGAAVHAHIRRNRMEAERFVGNDLVFMYAALGDPAEAKRIFDGLGSHNVLSFTAMMRAYTAAGRADDALEIFHLARVKAIAADPSMLALAVDAAAIKRDLALGQFFHGIVRRSGADLDLGVAAALVRMYSSCAAMDLAVAAFDRVKEFGRASIWNACLEGFVTNGEFPSAMRMFRSMFLDGVAMDGSSFRIALGLCRGGEDLPLGKFMHSCAEDRNLFLRRDLAVEFVRMYGIRCGRLGDAEAIFRKILKKDAHAWNAMMGSYLAHGRGGEAMEGFTAMCLSRVVPDRESFAAALESRPGIRDCKMIHALLVRNRVKIEGDIREKLVAAYGSTGRDGERTMAEIHERVVAWDERKRHQESYVFSFFDFQD